jgi:hypothetical protein
MFRFLTRWFARKSPPASLLGAQWTGTSYVDAYQRNRNPTPNELMAELKNTAWTCASINSAVCASHPPRLYIAHTTNSSPAKCPTRAIRPHIEERLRRRTHLQPYFTKARHVEEVTAHPLLDLLVQVNPVHNAFNL